MRARITLTRVHQINGPDYWQTDCYIQDHTLRRQGMTQQKALNKMYSAIDQVIYRDWYYAHAYNAIYDSHKQQLDAISSGRFHTYTPAMDERCDPTEPPLKWWQRLNSNRRP